VRQPIPPKLRHSFLQVVGVAPGKTPNGKKVVVVFGSDSQIVVVLERGKTKPKAKKTNETVKTIENQMQCFFQLTHFAPLVFQAFSHSMNMQPKLVPLMPVQLSSAFKT